MDHLVENKRDIDCISFNHRAFKTLSLSCLESLQSQQDLVNHPFLSASRLLTPLSIVNR